MGGPRVPPGGKKKNPGFFFFSPRGGGGKNPKKVKPLKKFGGPFRRAKFLENPLREGFFKKTGPGGPKIRKGKLWWGLFYKGFFFFWAYLPLFVKGDWEVSVIFSLLLMISYLMEICTSVETVTLYGCIYGSTYTLPGCGLKGIAQLHLI